MTQISRARTVELASKIGDLAIISEGLEAKDKVVIDALQQVAAGIEVKAEVIEFKSKLQNLIMADNKGNFFVHRPIVAMVIAIIIVIVGSVSVIGLAIEQYPNLTPPIVEVRGTYTGANALNVEESVATPIEQEMNGVDNMIYMKSTNSNDGTMVVQVSFDVGTDPDMITVLAQNRVSAATAKLPQAVTNYGVTTKKSLPNILMLISLTTDNPSHNNQEFLGNYGLINIKDRLARVPGIGRVDIMGSANYSMRIWVKPDRLAV